MFGFFKRKPRQVVDITNGPRTFSVEVVGESNYQDALERICGGRTEDGHKLEVEARLKLEDDNPYDGKAVAVTIDHELVGYLSRNTARSFRKALAAVAPKASLATCSAIIVGGWEREDDDRGHFGVRLDLPTL